MNSMIAVGRLAVVGLLCVAFSGCASASRKDAFGVAIDTTTQKPVPGVQVVFYVYQSASSPIPFARPVVTCGPEVTLVSDDQGRFVIPAGVLVGGSGVGFSEVSTSLNAIAYKRGYRVNRIGYFYDDSERPTIPKPRMPLRVDVDLAPDTSSPLIRARHIGEVGSKGCGCTELHQALQEEHRELMPLALREYLGDSTVPRSLPPGAVDNLMRKCK